MNAGERKGELLVEGFCCPLVRILASVDVELDGELNSGGRDEEKLGQGQDA